MHLDATEHGDGIVFLHAVKDGPANRSYGLQVAQLAGVPREVIAQARQYLELLESQARAPRRSGSGRGRAQRSCPCSSRQRAEPPPTERCAGGELREALDPDELSPRAALEALYRLRKLLVVTGRPSRSGREKRPCLRNTPVSRATRAETSMPSGSPAV